MKNLVLVGASHGERLYEALRTLPSYGTEFTAVSWCKKGKTFENLNWPHSLAENDLLICIPFGNELTPRSNTFYCKKTRICHLLRFEPYTAEYWDRLYRQLENKLHTLGGKAVIIDNIYRHVCCTSHKHPGWISYQQALNKQIRSRFSSETCRVVDHRQLLPLGFKKARSILEHRGLQYDSVHFRDYKPLAKRLLDLLR